jgi:hypothetical protein
MKGFGIEIKNDLLDPKHFERMGISVWLYMWLIDKMTSISEEGEGKVLGGKPIKFEDVGPEIGISERTYNRWISMLEKGKYIKTLRTPYGLVLTVLKAHKKFNKRYAKNGGTGKGEIRQICPSDTPDVAVLNTKSGGSNKTVSVDSIKDLPEAPPSGPIKVFSSEETKKKWYDGDKEDFQLLAWFFDQKGLWKKFDSREKVEHAVTRHIRPARRIVRGGWSEKECSEAVKKIKTNEKLISEWQLETLEKYLTK